MKRRPQFTTARPDGRTNADVLIALIQAVEPGHTYSYDEMAAALGEGTGRIWDRRAVQATIRQANPRILRQEQRLLQVITGVGYRVAFAADHSRLAMVRERRSESQLRTAVCILKNARLTELTPEQRTIHEAHLTVTAAVCAQMGAMARRQRKHDDAITQLMARMDKAGL